jgi:hypothetical protein
MALAQVPVNLAPSCPSSPALLGEPLQITSFSRDDTGSTTFDDSSLRYFREPANAVGFDLSRGYAAFCARYRTHRYHGHPRRLDEILQACLLQEDARIHLAGADIVTWRGLLTK